MYKGIPNCLRNKVWSILIEALHTDRTDPQTQASFQTLYGTTSLYEHQIDLDIERTLRNHILFRTRFGSGQSSLFKVLVALANSDPEVGYCQGMSSVAAFFLLYFEEETAFLYLRSLFRSQGLSQLYAVGFPKLFETFYLHERYLHFFYPRIARHLTRYQISTSVYATKWYMTLFLGFPYPVAARIWDLFLFYGYDVLLSVAMALLHTIESNLLASDYDQSMELLARCDSQGIDPDRFIKTLRRIWLASQSTPKLDLKKLRQMYILSKSAKPASI